MTVMTIEVFASLAPDKTSRLPTGSPSHPFGLSRRPHTESDRDGFHCSRTSNTNTLATSLALLREFTSTTLDTNTASSPDAAVDTDGLVQYGGTALHTAAGKGHCGALELLIQLGADVNVRDFVCSPPTAPSFSLPKPTHQCRTPMVRGELSVSAMLRALAVPEVGHRPSYKS